jgi:transcriptional regulator with XRE-family HTH domain
MAKNRTSERNLKPRLGDAGDAAVGPRIRALRYALGLSQVDLAKRLGVSFQQVQKYENGRNRVSASRLYHIANVLGVSVTLLLTGTEEQPGQSGADEAVALLNVPGALRLIKAYGFIENGRAKQAIVALAESLTKKSQLSDKSLASKFPRSQTGP